MPETAARGSETEALEVRLSVPAEGDLSRLAGDAAGKVAEFLGAKSPDAEAVRAAVDGLASQFANGGSLRDITFEFRQVDGELVINARCDGRSSEVRHQLR